MLTMVDKNEILIRFYRKGESKSEISRTLGITRKTVRKYINEHEKLKDCDELDEHLNKGLSTAPTYKTGKREKIRLTREVQEQIDFYLEKNKENHSKGFHKQLMKKADIHEALLEKGYEIGYTTVCNYVRKMEHKSKEAFIRQVYSAGEVCEFDWAEVKLLIQGELKKLNLAVFTCCYSNYRYAKLFYRQDTLAFSQSHIDFFSHLRGVPKELVYDNMSVVVRRFVGHSEKEATQGLLELSNYYHFGFRFCNVRRGNEKGHVERSVEYVRRKSFSNSIEFPNIEKANEHLEKRCHSLNNTPQSLLNNKTGHELIQDEKKYLYRVNSPYNCFTHEYAKVDKYSTIIYQGNRYSVPDYLVGKLLELKIFAEKIVVYQNGTEICNHIRSYGAHTWTLDLSHYLDTLLQKPGALAGSLALEQADAEINAIYKGYFKNDNKAFLELLKYCNDKNIDIAQLQHAIKKVEQITPHDISKDKILTVLECSPTPKPIEGKDNQIELCSRNLLDELSSLIINS